MRYETFDSEVHDVLKVAKLVYDVDFRTFDMLFKNPDGAVKAIAKDLRRNEIEYCFKVIFDDNDEMVGILKMYSADTHHKFHFKSIKLIIVDILDHFVLCDIKKGDLYLSEIAIDESFRGQGIGRKVILDAIEYARSKNFKRLILDVDLRNEGAKSLYEKLGFKEFNKKSLKLGSFERGMYNMELIL